MEAAIVFDAEAVRLAFVVGIVVSALFYDRSHLSTGSVVVPGYLGLCLGSPLTVVATFVNAVAIFLVVHRLLPRVLLMSRAAKFHAVLIGSAAMQVTWFHLAPEATHLGAPGLVGIGYLIPGLIAHDLNRQGPAKTLVSITVCSAVVGLVVALASHGLSVGLGSAGGPPERALAVGAGFVPVVMLLSTTAAVALKRNYDARCGGFVGSAYLGLLVLDPLQVLYFAVMAVATYLVVTRVLMRHLIVFGRRKFAAMLLFGGLFSWAGLWLLEGLLQRPVVAVWSWTAPPFVSVLLTGLLANDMERSAPRRVLLGTALATMLALTGGLLLAEVAGAARPERLLVLGPAFAASAVAVFGPDLMRWLAVLLRPLRAPSEGEPAGVPLGARLRLSALGAGALVALVLLATPELSGLPGGAESALVRDGAERRGRPYLLDRALAPIGGELPPWIRLPAFLPFLGDAALRSSDAAAPGPTPSRSPQR